MWIVLPANLYVNQKSVEVALSILFDNMIGNLQGSPHLYFLENTRLAT